MASQHKFVSINARSGWYNVGLDNQLSIGDHLTIIRLQSARGVLPERTVEVPSDVPGFDTGIYVEADQTVTITADGWWNHGGNGYDANGRGLPIYNPQSYAGSGWLAPGLVQFKLIGKVGSGSWAEIGSSGSFVSTSSGNLYLAMNDTLATWTENDYYGNTGSMIAQVTVTPDCDSRILPTQPDDVLVARIGSGTPVAVGTVGDRYEEEAISTAGTLQLSANGCFDGSITALVIVNAPGDPTHEECIDTTPASENPIKLRSGDKILSETDLLVPTAAGSLSFTRQYTQSKQDHAEYQFMGLGWSHDHARKLSLAGTSPNRTAEVYLPGRGILRLSEDSGNAGHFDALAGSTSVLDYDATNSEYVLTLQDQSQYIFDDSLLRLKRRSWPNNERWFYSYYTSSDGADLDGKLKQIGDNYNRALQFTYIRDTDPDAYQRRKLWRVGDQSATGLDGSSPAGRYVEFGYRPEKVNGSAITGARALLYSVKDMRGQVWTYDYFGQTSGETDTKQLNFLTKRLSPSVDTGGDGTPDGTLTLEALTYTTETTTLAVNGDMEVDSDWSSVGTPGTNERSNVQVDGGSYSRYVEADTLGEGIESVNWELVPGRVYVITARVYPVTGKVKMQIKGASVSDESQSGTGVWETLRVVYSPAGDAQQRQLQFLASEVPGGLAKFYVDTVVVSRLTAIEQERGEAALVTEFTFQPSGKNITTETVNGKVATHHFSNGVYVGQANPDHELSAQVIGDDYRPLAQVDANGSVSELDWSANGKNLNGVTDALGHDTTFIYDAFDRLQYSLDNEGRKTLYIYDGNQRQPMVTLVDPATNLVSNGSMEADSNWASIGDFVTNEQSSRQIDSGSYARRVVTDEVGEGIQSELWDLIAKRTYIVMARVYPVNGKVKMQVTGTSAFDRSSSGTGAWETLRAVYTPTTTATGRHLQFVAENAGETEFYIDTVSISEIGGEIDINGGMEIDSGWTAVGSPSPNEHLTSQVHTGNHARYVDTSAAGQGIEGNTWDLIANQTYTITARVYPVSGTVKMQVPGVSAFDKTTSGSGNWQLLSATYTPGSGATGKKLQFLADGGAAQFYVDAVSIITTAEVAVNGGMEADSDWTSVNSPTTNQRSSTQADTGTYSRRVVASAANQGIEGNTWDLLANQTYTLRARVYPVSGQVKMQVPSVSDFDVSTAETGAWQTLSATHIPGSDVTGKKLQFVSLGGAAEFYVDTVSISLTRELAANGDMEDDSGWTGVSSPTTNARRPRVDSGDYYRHIKVTAANDGIESATWDLKANRTYLVMARVYSAKGTIKMQVPGLSAFDKTTTGTGTWETLRAIHKPTSDASGKTVQFIATALVSGEAEFYVDTVHIIDLGVIASSAENEVRWQEFAYDRQGRTIEETALSAKDAALIQQVKRSYHAAGNGSGLLKEVIQKDVVSTNDVTTTYTYDPAGRVVKVLQKNLLGDCCGSLTDYDAAGNVLSSTSIRDTANFNDPVLNPVTAYGYDTLGRRTRTTINSRTATSQMTLTAYDALDRVKRSIGNYKSDAGIANPYTAARNLFDHGTDNNQNLITDTAYNARGMVESQTDVLGSVTRLVYNDAGRLVRTIASYVAQGATDPKDWVWDATTDNRWERGVSDNTAIDHGTNNDQNLIAEQVYDSAGNVVETIDVLRKRTITVYDALNRPVKTVRAAKDAATITLNPGDGGYNAANDSRSASYTPSTDPDRDLIETTEYDAMGRVMRSQRLLDNRPTAQWDTTLFGYDPLGRQIKVIRSASQPTYNIAADPALSAYTASTNPDQDIFTRTIYDAQGRVLETETLRDDNSAITKTRFVYDGLGRQVKTIGNYVDQGEDPSLWVWDAGDTRWEKSGGTAINHGTNNDQNIITETIYDANGRVESTRDVLGRVSRNVYDTLGRVIRTVTNFVDQGEDPFLWVWNSGWKKSNGTTPISHGTDDDENIISSTVYDAQGRVSSTIDHRNNEMLYIYDVLGRRLKTITNYLVQGASNPADWLWDAGDSRWEDGGGNAISFGTDKDQNRLSTTVYDLAGRVTSSRDAAGIETRVEYDALGRRTETTVNYVNGVYNASFPDEDLISTTTYNKGGQVVTTADARGTQTAFTYDQAGRRLTITQAAESTLESVSYTCYDKAGRVLRTIQNWIDDNTSPDDKAGSGDWLFMPPHNGHYHDRNLITASTYDLASRRSSVTNPVGSITATAYFKDGQVKSVTDPESVVTQYRYDRLRRRTRVVQGFVDQAEDPSLWVWDVGDTRWEKSGGTAIAHGSNKDQNIIVLVAYDIAGRMLSLRNPEGYLTSYAYDLLNRRKSLTNPISETWETAYPMLTTGGTRTVLTDPNGVDTQRDFDRLGRLASVQYDDPADTPDVKMTYNNVGSRSKMTEYSGASFSSPIRETSYSYDDVRRLTSVGFDNDGGGSVDETVSYEYDAGGLRTKLTLPGSLEVVYTYDQRGQLVSLTDWDSQPTQFAHDLAGRLITVERANGLRSRYHLDAAGRLKLLRHTKDSRTLGHFEYSLDKRGNRTQALEALPHPTTTSDTTVAYNDKGLVAKGTWSNVSNFKESTEFSASLKLIFFGDEATLTMGTGPDHSIYDLYIGGSLWQSFDGYAASASQRDILISAGVDNRKLQSEGPHLLEIRNRAEKNKTSTGYKVRFKQLVVADRTYDLHTIEYAYDNLSRLREARYNPGTNVDAADGDLLRRYLYTFDLAGNRTQQIVSIAGTPTTTNYDYNGANQLIDDGTYTYEYDANGNLRYKKLTGTPVEEYTWNRANRLVTWDNGTAADLLNYSYDGLNNRISRSLGTTSPTVTKYLLDLQPGLSVVLAATEDTDVTRYVHGPMGIHAQEDPAGAWSWMVKDALGSVRNVVDNSVAVTEVRLDDPFGNPVIGAPYDYAATVYGFTGELTETVNPLVHLRARDYNPVLGVFTALDPFEGMTNRPMSLNGYLYVEGNVVNAVDPSGRWGERPEQWDNCITDFCSCYDGQPNLYAFWCRLGEIPNCIDYYAGGGGYFSDDPTPPRGTPCQSIREYARNLRTWDDSGVPIEGISHTDLDALVELIEFASRLPGVTTSQQMANDISCALLNASGPRTIIWALMAAPAAKHLHFGETTWDWFRDTGFHSDYHDAGNQINHFWAFMNTAAQGDLRASMAGNLIHEHLGIPEIFMSENGASIQDERLTYLGFALGLAINQGLVPPDRMASLFREYLSSPYPDSDPSDPSQWTFQAWCRTLRDHLPTNNLCSADASDWTGG